jgi:predicted  nucleic acid-binding Zn-ribbon protein
MTSKELKQVKAERDAYKKAVEDLREFIRDMLKEVKK